MKQSATGRPSKPWCRFEHVSAAHLCVVVMRAPPAIGDDDDDAEFRQYAAMRMEQLSQQMLVAPPSTLSREEVLDKLASAQQDTDAALQTKYAAIARLATWCDPQEEFAEEHHALVLECGATEVLLAALARAEDGGSIPPRTPASETLQVQERALEALSSLAASVGSQHILKSTQLRHLVALFACPDIHTRCAATSCLQAALDADSESLTALNRGVVDALLRSLQTILDDETVEASRRTFIATNARVDVFKEPVSAVFDLSKAPPKARATMEAGDQVFAQECIVGVDNSLQIKFEQGKRKSGRKLPRPCKGWVLVSVGTTKTMVQATPDSPDTSLKMTTQSNAVNIVRHLSKSAQLCTQMTGRGMELSLGRLLFTVNIAMLRAAEDALTKGFGRDLAICRRRGQDSMADTLSVAGATTFSFRHGDDSSDSQYYSRARASSVSSISPSGSTRRSGINSSQAPSRSSVTSARGSWSPSPEEKRDRLPSFPSPNPRAHGIDEAASTFKALNQASKERGSGSEEEGRILIHKGWMDKKVGITPVWRRRWCELHESADDSSSGPVLILDKMPGETAKRQVLNMSECGQVEATKKSIDIQCGRTYRFNCDNPIEREEWLRALKSVHAKNALESSTQETLLHSGWLRKKVGVTTNWRRRWCELYQTTDAVNIGAMLRLYKDEEPDYDSPPLTEIDITECEKVMVQVHGMGDQTIDVQCKDRTYRLKCDLVTEIEPWLDAFTATLETIAEHKAHTARLPLHTISAATLVSGPHGASPPPLATPPSLSEKRAKPPTLKVPADDVVSPLLATETRPRSGSARAFKAPLKSVGVVSGVMPSRRASSGEKARLQCIRLHFKSCVRMLSSSLSITPSRKSSSC